MDDYASYIMQVEIKLNLPIHEFALINMCLQDKSNALTKDLVNRYGIDVSHITTDMFHLSPTPPGPFLIHDLSPAL
jgi:hypothetical protein